MRIARKSRAAGVGADIKRAAIAKLARIYDEALRRSRKVERPIRLVVHVDAEGAPEITAEYTVVGTPAGPSRSHEDNPAELERALTAARARGKVRVAEILSGAEMLSADEFAARVGTSRVTVNEWRQNRKILGLEGAKRGFRFPEWQVGENGKPFGVLPMLFDTLGGDAWAVYRFLVQHHPELDGLTGAEALRRGQSDKVVETAEIVARAFG